MAGYSGKPLAQKLGIKAGMKMLVINVPENYSLLLGDLPEEVTQVKDKTSVVGFIHLFVKKISELEKLLPPAVKRLEQNGMIWISWYKKSSGISTDVTEDAIRVTAFPLGLVDVKVCAVDEQWSGLKLVIRKENRR
ncbi:MAG TPA: hypothetical protein VE978_26080 [Chitinophagales bacterium]|nr:hypothetical protein [Chitinophagales bacterium]